MELHTWIAFALTSLLISITPGPGAVLAMAQGSRLGIRLALPTLLGLELGGATIFVLASVGVGSLLLSSATAFNAAKIAGAAYLIWLGIRQWRSVHQGPGTVQEGQDSSVAQRFISGFLTNVANPKGIVFIMAILPQFISQSSAVLPQLATMALTMLLVDLMVMTAYAGGANYLGRLLNSTRAIKVQGRILGGVLVGMGLSLFFVRNTRTV